MEYTNGVIEDPRSKEEVARDYKHDELVSAVLINWQNKPAISWKSYSVRNQDGSFSCLGQSVAKALETFSGEIESAHPIYRPRFNFPQVGMWLQNAGEIAKHKGTTTEDKDKSQNIGETEMNRDVTIETPYKIDAYVFPNFRDIDEIAQAIEVYKHCILTVAGSVSEWDNKPVYNKNANINLFHGICAVDYFLLDGEKCILIDDSWGNATTIGNHGQRIITEDYLEKRCTGAMYFIPKLTEPDNKPKYKFTKPLIYGLRNNVDVVKLQDILKYEGIFPNNTQSTGNFLSITANCVKKFQVKYGIMDFANTTDMRKIRVGPKTIKKLNELYS